MAYLVGGRSRDPRDLAPVGAYMTDGDVLVQIIDSDAVAALAEDVCTQALIPIGVVDLMQRWRRVTPAAQPDPRSQAA
jgi:hypothetical protein